MNNDPLPVIEAFSYDIIDHYFSDQQARPEKNPETHHTIL
jgi:hypothetical protein